MPFLKADPAGGPDFEASFSIKSPDYEITNLNHADYTFPVDGWEYVEVLPTPLPVLPDFKPRKLVWAETRPKHFVAETPFGYIIFTVEKDGSAKVQEAPWSFLVASTYPSPLIARHSIRHEYFRLVLKVAGRIE